ncbi:MAG TPA: LysE family transporter [Rhodocyclaceae bacterium]|jgi:homoserine/homoserine lactone efflux protein
MALHLWLAFLSASLAISLSPGPGAFASMASGLRNGFLRGYWVVIGLQLGILALLAVVAAGVGALIVSSAGAFEVLRWIGVAYLFWLAWGQWRSDGSLESLTAGSGQQSRQELVWRGFLVDATNPKGLLFFFAVVPQFLEPGLALPPQYATIAATVVTVDMTVMAGYTLLAARALHWLHSPRRVRWISRGFSLLFIFTAISLALFRHHAI